MEPSKAKYTQLESPQHSDRPSSEEGYIGDEEGLLKQEPDSNDGSSRSRRPRWPAGGLWPLLHIFLLSLYTIVFFALSYKSIKASHREVYLIPCILNPNHRLCIELISRQAPLNEALISEKKMVRATFRSQNPFKGKPSPELDHAWHELFVYSNVRVSAGDLQKINRTSVPIGDGAGYYAIPGEHRIVYPGPSSYLVWADTTEWVDVYHQLHCLVC